MQVIEIGKTEEGRPHLAAIITAPENFAKLDRYKQISQQLHRARGLDRRAGARAGQGRQGGRLDRRRPARDRSRRRAPADRDGLSAREPHRRGDDAHPARRDRRSRCTPIPTACRWSRSATCRTPDPLQRRTCSPRLYNKYAGHDNNRDFYMSNTKESQNMNKLMYWEWLPQIMYNHHQTGPGRHGDLHAAVPRSVQLQLRSDDRHRPRHGRRGDAPPLPAGREAGLHDALRLVLLDLVERRAAHDGVLPEHHRPPDRDHRQSRRRRRSRPTASQILPRARSAGADRAAGRGTSASRSTTR